MSNAGVCRKRRRFPVPVLLALAVLVPSPPAGAAPTPATSYVALGDSFAAGPLIPPPDPVTAGCTRSGTNYPRLLAARYQIADFRDVSCSGASTRDMFTPQAVQPGPNPAQLDAVDAGTGLVTLQVGGNDIGFGEIVSSCLALLPLGTPCRDRYVAGGVDRLSARIQAARPKVDAVLAGIKAKAPGATIYLIGYPSLLPEDLPGCWPFMPYAPGDGPYLIQIEKELNDMLSQSAAANGAFYVDLYTPSLGRDACRPSTDRWVEPVVLPVLGAPVHPNLLGMAGMEAVIATVVDATMP